MIFFKNLVRRNVFTLTAEVHKPVQIHCMYWLKYSRSYFVLQNQLLWKHIARKLTFVYGSLVNQSQNRFLAAAILSSWDRSERFSLASVKNDDHAMASLTCGINLRRRSCFRAVVPKLFRTVTRIKVAIISYYPQWKVFAFHVENFFSSDLS